MTATLQKTSKERFAEVLPELMKNYDVKNRLAAPRITKVCLNMGVGRAIQDGAILNVLTEHLSLIAGQKAVVTTAKKSIAQFRSREGQKIGCRVTLRGDKMWSFLDKLINLAIPRIRDFRGLSSKRGFDKAGNFNMGMTEQALFPEVQLDKMEHNQGLNITICIENSNGAQSFDLLKGLGMPFREK